MAKKKKARQDCFLTEIDAVTPWVDLELIHGVPRIAYGIRLYVMSFPRCLFFILLLTVCLAHATEASSPKQSTGHQSRYQSENRDSSFVDSIGTEFALIRSGEFRMGGSETAESLVAAFPNAGKTADYFADEYPTHRVRISKAFLLSKFEVTVAQFRLFTEGTGYKTEAETDGTGGWGYNVSSGQSEGRRLQYSWRDPGFSQTDRHPVVNVGYNDALAFIRWLSTKEGKHYRLPTEAEWEYANRAGSQTRYANSENPGELSRFARAIDLSRHAEFGHVQSIEIDANDPTAFTAPVGSYEANAFGLYDMHGNVWEWVADWYGETYYAESPEADPQGPGFGEMRVRRGGAWNSFPIWLRSSFRNWNTPDSRCLNLGFRVARDL